MPSTGHGSPRKLLESILKIDADIDAFLIDYFPAVKKRCANGMDTKSKLNLLLEMIDSHEILSALRAHSPELVNSHSSARTSTGNESEISVIEQEFTNPDNRIFNHSLTKNSVKKTEYDTGNSAYIHTSKNMSILLISIGLIVFSLAIVCAFMLKETYHKFFISISIMGGLHLIIGLFFFNISMFSVKHRGRLFGILVAAFVLVTMALLARAAKYLFLAKAQSNMGALTPNSTSANLNFHHPNRNNALDFGVYQADAIADLGDMSKDGKIIEGDLGIAESERSVNKQGILRLIVKPSYARLAFDDKSLRHSSSVIAKGSKEISLIGFPGTYRITLSAPGYVTKITDFKIFTNTATYATLMLEPNGSSPEEGDSSLRQGDCGEGITKWENRPSELSGKSIRVEEGEIRLLCMIFFRQNDMNIDASYGGNQKSLLDASLVLLRRTSLQIEIQGHSSQTETSGVSKQRACNVMNRLIEMGVSRERLSCVGYDAQRPLSLDNLAQNRRVQYLVTGSSPNSVGSVLNK